MTKVVEKNYVKGDIIVRGHYEEENCKESFTIKDYVIGAVSLIGRTPQDRKKSLWKLGSSPSGLRYKLTL